jgi:prepilin-type N-terminal cleavage/methylation domain-containing protein
MKRNHRIRLNQKAFTIVELLIATAILSTILVMVTTMMVSIGNLYYKGVNQARVQDDVRNITDEVAQHLQLSDAGPLPPAVSPNGKIKAYCIGDTRYTFTLNTQIGNLAAQSPHVLWRDNNPTPDSCATTNTFLASPPPATNGTELIVPNSSLTFFSISNTSPYTVSVGVAFGDLTLLNLNGLNTHCKGNLGDQFCATSTLTTTVAQRIN